MRPCEKRRRRGEAPPRPGFPSRRRCRSGRALPGRRPRVRVFACAHGRACRWGVNASFRVCSYQTFTESCVFCDAPFLIQLPLRSFCASAKGAASALLAAIRDRKSPRGWSVLVSVFSSIGFPSLVWSGHPPTHLQSPSVRTRWNGVPDGTPSASAAHDLGVGRYSSVRRAQPRGRRASVSPVFPRPPNVPGTVPFPGHRSISPVAR